MKPVVDAVKSKYEDRVDFRILDVDQPKNESEAQKYGINAIPAFIFIDSSGTKVDEVVGTMTEEEFEGKIGSILK